MQLLYVGLVVYRENLSKVDFLAINFNRGFVVSNALVINGKACSVRQFHVILLGENAQIICKVLCW